MIRRAAALVTLVALLAGGLVSSAAAAADRNGKVTPAAAFEWQGTLASGSNQGYDPASGEPCGKNPDDYCDTTLLNIDVRPDYWQDHEGGVEVSLTNYSPSTASDFDLYIYRSDAQGNRGAQDTSSGGVPGAEEHAVIKKASGYYLVQVVYYAVVASQYNGTAAFVTFPRLNVPPDVDSPAGLQDVLASNPKFGYKSHSEPHLAQSPLNSDLLIGGSKFYNKDRDSLDEYEFKIGTYVSFNGGKKWTDLGQMATCPLSEAPPETWPDQNTCYPVDIPSKGGTGPEDVNDPDDKKDAFDNRGTGDVGEEYITSDVWIQFDDEGNAYAMVLDHPPYPDTENGWGMTLHIWKSVSKADLKTGKTWGPRIPINSYGPDQRTRFLDDKNTFTVNNAGPDLDGSVGTMVACWGQNIPDAIKQQTVCERSTDGGQTWPDPPTPISGVEQLVIGVHVLADPSEPDTFYAAWLQYASGIADPNVSTLEFAVSLDGGITWTEAPVTTVHTVPKFPYQDFRNNTIPIMAVAPDHAIYVSYGDYRAAPKPDEDEDGLSSDIMVVKSTTRGASWEAPIVVNQDGTNADQFQPYIDINKAGQINIAFFDRRNDVKIVRNGELIHGGNFFIDVYLARSSDGGATFKEQRVSHDMWDPRINPPISPSGAFIGDYQGMVADTCVAIPFYNDTHLANASTRDPDFDRGEPRSKYQELISWRVKNRTSFTGKVDDSITGGFGRDRLCGLAGNDTLTGSKGNDVLRGGAGDDKLIGGPGRDYCIGGPGKDTFKGCERKRQ